MGPTESVHKMRSNGSYVRTVEEKELKEKEKERERERELHIHVHMYILSLNPYLFYYLLVY